MASSMERAAVGKSRDVDVAPGERPTVADGAAPAPVRRGWLDLILVTGVALAGLFVGGLPVELRLPIGLMAVLFSPGYALIAAVFPTDEHLDRAERWALSLGMSLGLIPVQALLLDRVPGGLAPTAIQSTVVVTTLGFALVAARRRAVATPRPDAGAAPPSDGDAPARPTRRAVRFTQALIAANVIIAGLAYGLTIGASPPRPTEFYVLGRSGQLADYPREAGLGETLRLTVGVRQQLDQAGQYEIVARQGQSVVGSLDAISLGPGREWQAELPVTTSVPGPDQELTIELRRPGATAPVRTLRLWLNVRPERR
jgi:uncharacterized membrane protein